MNVLFIHRRLPAQFKHLLLKLAEEPGNKVFGICRADAPILQDSHFSAVKLTTYQPTREVTPNVHHYVIDLEKSVLNGQAVAGVLQAYKDQGIQFDLAFAHIGWGESLYFKEIFPDVPLIGYSEYYYHSKGTDVDFDPLYPVSIDHQLKVKTLNAQVLLSIAGCDICVTPTCWQKQLFPKELHSKIRVIHEGIDIENIKPDANAAFMLPNGLLLTKQVEVITYTARNLEPYRGFPVFMRAVAEICRRRPNCHIIITGGDDVSYSLKLPNGQSYREQALREVTIDPTRVHFLGTVAYATHLQILQVSSAHIYLTYPFVLSWSFMEALASGCVLIASNTAPVLEVLQHEQNGLLVDFFDYQQIADQVDRVFAHPTRMQHLAVNAGETIAQHYALANSLAQYRQLYESLLH